MKQLQITLLMLFLSVLLIAQNNDPVNKLIDQLNAYSSYYPGEMIYVQTDKDLYAPGESIYFSVIAKDERNNQLSTISKNAVLKLYSSTGKLISNNKVVLENGISEGIIVLDENAPEGNYFLSGQLEYQTNMNSIFTRKIAINNNYKNELKTIVTLKNGLLDKGENEFIVNISDEEDKAQKNEKLTYTIFRGLKIIDEGKLKTDSEGNASIKVNLDNSKGFPYSLVLKDQQDKLLKQMPFNSYMDSLKISFYPEGGNLIPEKQTRIGFYAQNKLGQTIPIKGFITDQSNNKLIDVQSLWKGFGLFQLKPNKSDRYKLIITSDIGAGQEFNLPSVNPKGLSLSVLDNADEYIALDLTFADHENHDVALTITQGNIVYWGANILVDGNRRIKIPNKELPSGISLITCFAKEGFPLAERLIDINNNELKLEMTSSQKLVKTDDKFSVDIQLKDHSGQAIEGLVNIAVVDQMNVDSTQVAMPVSLDYNSLLVNPINVTVKDYEKGIHKSRIADYFLIANKLKNHDWAKIFRFNPDDQSTENNDEPCLTATVVDQEGNAIANATVNILNKKSLKYSRLQTDVDGQFTIKGITNSDLANFDLNLSNIDKGLKPEIIYQKSMDELIAEKIQLMDRKSAFASDQNVTTKYYNDNKDLFSGSKKRKTRSLSENNSYKTFLETGTSILEVLKIIKPYSLQDDLIIFPGGQNSINNQDGALIVVDGQKLGTSASVLNGLNPHDVESINVSTSPVEIQRYTGLNSVGLIEIVTKRGGEPENIEESAEGVKATGTTIYYKTALKTDENGILKFEIPTGKIISDFIIQLNGIANNGQVGTLSTSISVE